MLNSNEILGIVNDSIGRLPFDRKPQSLYEPIKYVLSLGGKRMRPVLMLLAYNLFKDDPQSILSQACGLETYHNYTLLHDDLMDRADMRRGKPTVHKKWNDNTAVLSGDTMLIMAFRHIMDCPCRRQADVLRLFARSAQEICEGQQYDVNFETRTDVTEAEYIEMIRLKTSVLLGCAVQMGALIADAPDADCRALYRFAEKVGLAFQLQDDYLDVYGDPKVFGKKIGGDILCAKKTFLLINALNRADDATRSRLLQLLDDSGCEPEAKIQAVTGLDDQLGIPALTLQAIDRYYAEAHTELQALSLPQEQWQPLWDYACSLLGRNK